MKNDRVILYAGAFVRALATGMAGVLLGVYLAKFGLGPAGIGSAIGAGLVGGALAALVVTLAGDRLGRGLCLRWIALLSAAGGILFALATSPVVLIAAAFLGMINGMGRDRGAGLILDQAILPSTTSDEQRTTVFAWYNVIQDLGGALGGLLAGTPALLRATMGVGEERSLRLSMAIYVLLFLVAAALYLGLSRAVEQPLEAGRPRSRLSPASRKVVGRITALFTVDSLAGGFLTTALLSFFFYERFGVGEGALGPLFFAARVANALSHLGAAWLARRIGLVNTMVFTHIPASLLLILVAVVPSFPVAALLLVVRESLVEMDVPTRQSYVMAVVKPEERTVAAGATNMVRIAAWSVGPWFAGLFMQGLSLATPLMIGAGMKIAYDLLLYSAFRNLKPPEEARNVLR